MRLLRSSVAVAAGACAVLLAMVTGPRGVPPALAAPTLPRYDHVVLAVFENHEQSQVIGSGQAPYLTALAKQGANFTQSYAIQHPSQPNYLELFSGSNQGVNDDSCPHTFGADNIGHQLIVAGRSFAGFSEGLPSAGSRVCTSGRYARKHVPWSNFSDLNQDAVNRPYSAFPSDFNRLPANAWVIPDLCDDMHSCPVTTGDTWAKAHLNSYAQWAKTHNSLLIVTFDEDDSAANNRIATIFVGAHVRPGSYRNHVDHYTVLRTVEGIFRLPALGGAKGRTPMTNVFSGTGAASGLPASHHSYRITVAGSHRVIDDRRSSTGRGTRMIIYPDHNGRNQRWTAHAVGPGTYTFRNVASGLCLDNARGSAAAGNRIIQWTCTGAGNQRWRVRSTGSGYQIVSAGSGLALRAGSGSIGTLSQQHSGTVWEFVAG
jgi:hypothetical protein